MLDLERRIAEIKMSNAFDKCFESSFYDVCSLLDLEGRSTTTFELLRSAHCIHFNKFTDSEISELKKLTQEVIDYTEILPTKSWWRVLC